MHTAWARWDLQPPVISALEPLFPWCNLSWSSRKARRHFSLSQVLQAGTKFSLKHNKSKEQGNTSSEHLAKLPCELGGKQSLSWERRHKILDRALGVIWERSQSFYQDLRSFSVWMSFSPPKFRIILETFPQLPQPPDYKFLRVLFTFCSNWESLHLHIQNIVRKRIYWKFGGAISQHARNFQTILRANRKWDEKVSVR